MNTPLEIREPLPSIRPPKEQWREDVVPYRQTSLAHSLWQIATTLIPLVLIWYAMYVSLSYAYWITLALAPLAAGCHTRAFIIFHDCGHGSFFKSSRANDILGFVCGVVCLTPYYYWRHSHAIHHATSGDLSRRIEGQVLPMNIGKYVHTNGNILTLTVKEYQQLSKLAKLVYRIYRHPLVLFVLIPTFLFVVLHRFASPLAGKRERYSVYGTNLALLAVCSLLIFNIGLIPFVLVELPIVVLTTTIAVWMFYVQHQFQETYWDHKAEWSFVKAALEGSSYYKLPRILQWFTGNIGFHHVHHLAPRIPNYYLQKCHEASTLFQQTNAITLWSSVRTIFSNLWDEEQRTMIGFGQLKPTRSTPPLEPE